ncbi:hypothetical protein CAOG_05078 [Capsaspora owczarzaki ATCC 30864]|uniref:G-protein coupled receptors family 3 profile domain-containing protein n=1 Tax=Capsaspora owczarzaki (strain ATCC 30864) TaxID=595528 RepID=A0A0D2WRC7_CAPO3|nr:hypothetical protein CAOG_05078 [Capsaspora owczarzaki ATCC 30864]KJE94435.1 hypothetical protein CAOG_005078 [Capsaspora owczarzaki ATCC 30864]|eukprot:XP_004346763.2 hypothetical protein CAOG_05078 [Capsaspora owczarzaki ATCC 30864]
MTAGMQHQLGRHGTAPLQLRVIIVGVLLVLASASSTVQAATTAGGAGSCLYHSSSLNYNSIGVDKFVDNFPTTAVTIEFWVRYRNDFKVEGQQQCVISVASSQDDNVVTWSRFLTDFRLYINPFLSIPDAVGPITGPAADYNGNWHHWGLSFNVADGRTILTYDGNVLYNNVSAARASIPLPSTVAFVLGQDQDAYYGGFDSTQAFVGMIDELRVWKVARTPAQLADNKNLHLDAMATPDLWGAWSFDEGSGPLAYNDVAIPGGYSAPYHPVKLGGFSTSAASGCDGDDATSRTPLWADSTAPVVGSGPVRVRVSPTIAKPITLGAHSTLGSFTLAVGSYGGACPNLLLYRDAACTNLIATSGAAVASSTIYAKSSAGFSGCAFSYTVTDADNTATGYVNVSVNHAPTPITQTISGAEDLSVLRVGLTGTDVDGDLTSTSRITQLPAHGFLYTLNNNLQRGSRITSVPFVLPTEAGGVLYSAPLNSYSTDFDFFTYDVADMNGAWSNSSATVRISISVVADLPKAVPNPFMVTYTGVEYMTVRDIGMNSVVSWTGGFTMEMWISMTTAPTGQPYILMGPALASTSSSSFSFEIVSGSLLALRHLGSVVAVQTVGTVPLNVWSHVALSLTGSSANLYLNGNLVGTAVLGSTLSSVATSGISIGQYFVGSLDEIALWNTSSRMTADFFLLEKVSSTRRPNLVAAWPLDAGIGMTALCFGNSYFGCSSTAFFGNGSLSAAPLWADNPGALVPSFPNFGTEFIEEDTEQIIRLSSTDVDSESLIVGIVVTSLPTNGKLYQYVDNGGGAYSRGPLLDSYKYWVSEQEPAKTWVEQVAHQPGVTVLGVTGDTSLKFSTQYLGSTYGVLALVGGPSAYNPGVPNGGYGDTATAWCPSTTGDYNAVKNRPCLVNSFNTVSNPFNFTCPANQGNEYVEVRMGESLVPHSFAVYENYWPGATTKISARHEPTNTWIPVWEAPARTELYDNLGNYMAGSYVVFQPQACQPAWTADVYRVEIATHLIPGWNEIDALSMTGVPLVRAGVVNDPLGRLIFVPDADFDGVDQLSFAASDCLPSLDRQTADQVLTLNVVGTSDAPVLTPTNFDATVGSVLAIPLPVYDPDSSDVLHFKFNTVPSVGTLFVTHNLSDTTFNVNSTSTTTITAGTVLVASPQSARSLTVFYSQADQGCVSTQFAFTVSDNASRATATPYAPAVQVEINFACPTVNTQTAYADSDGARYFFVVLAAIFILIAFGFLLFLMRNWSSRIIVASSPTFLALILFGALLSYVWIFLAAPTPTDALCAAMPWVRHLGFCFVFGALFLKTYRIDRIFNNDAIKRIRMKDTVLFHYMFRIVLMFALYLAIWTGISRPISEVRVDITSDQTNQGVFVTQQLVPRCSSNWFDSAILIVELMFLIWGLYLAIKVRHTPTAFNESKYIVVAVYNFVFVAVVLQIILQTAIKDRDIAYVLESIYVIFTVSAVVLLIFVPKVSLVRNGGIAETRESYTHTHSAPKQQTMDKQVEMIDRHRSTGHNNSTSHHSNNESDLEVGTTTVQPAPKTDNMLRSENKRLIREVERLKQDLMTLGNRHLATSTAQR